jgi:hypothetical protein
MIMEELESQKLSKLLKKFDALTDFGKEMLFCYLVGGFGATKDNEKFNRLMKEMDNWIDWGKEFPHVK